MSWSVSLTACKPFVYRGFAVSLSVSLVVSLAVPLAVPLCSQKGLEAHREAVFAAGLAALEKGLEAHREGLAALEKGLEAHREAKFGGTRRRRQAHPAVVEVSGSAAAADDGCPDTVSGDGTLHGFRTVGGLVQTGRP